MASRTFRDMQALQRGHQHVAGSFAPNGGSAIAAASNLGQGLSVAYSATGVYTITLEDSYKELIDAQCSLQLVTDANVMVRFASIDVVTAKTVIIHAVQSSDGTTGVAIAANANNRIHFHLTLRSTDIN